MTDPPPPSPFEAAAAPSTRPGVGWLVTLWKRAFVAAGAPYLRRVAQLDGDRHRRLLSRLDEASVRMERLAAAVESVERMLRLRGSAGTIEPAPTGALGASAAKPAIPEEAYFAFEEEFRGSEGSVSSRQRAWVEEFRSAGSVVDLGCGRGEFLRLLRDAGLDASGVDRSAWMVARCREKGLVATHDDGRAYLAGLPEASVGGVFASHLVEHLPPESLVALLAQVARVLRPGGRFVAETPNGTSVAVLARGFYRDPTHLRPVHPDTLAHLARSAGFARTEIRFLEPFPADERLPPADDLAVGGAQASKRFAAAWERLDALLYGHQDYALVATR